MITKFLYVGRLEKVKGIDILIKAFDKLSKKYDGRWRLDILGDGSLMKKFKSNDLVIFHGWGDKLKVARLMQKGDCLIIPSRSESLPLVLLEAAQFNLPVITSNVGDCPYLVKKYNIGMIFKKGDVNSLASKLDFFLKNGKEIIKGARFSDLREDFSLEKSAKFFLNKIV